MVLTALFFLAGYVFIALAHKIKVDEAPRALFVSCYADDDILRQKAN